MWAPWRERAQVGGGEDARQQELRGGRPEHVRSSLPEIWKSGDRSSSQDPCHSKRRASMGVLRTTLSAAWRMGWRKARLDAGRPA